MCITFLKDSKGFQPRAAADLYRENLYLQSLGKTFIAFYSLCEEVVTKVPTVLHYSVDGPDLRA